MNKSTLIILLLKLLVKIIKNESLNILHKWFSIVLGNQAQKVVLVNRAAYCDNYIWNHGNGRLKQGSQQVPKRTKDLNANQNFVSIFQIVFLTAFTFIC